MKTEWRKVYGLILERNLSICQRWYEELKIEDLLPKKDEIFTAIIDTGKWDVNPKMDSKMKELFSQDQVNNIISKPLLAGNQKILIYFTYKKELDEMLAEYNIEFGIFERDPGNFIKSISLSDKEKMMYETDSRSYIQSYFTLISHDEESYIDLFKSFVAWLKRFPNKEIKNLAKPFINSLAEKYRNRL